MLQHSIPAMVDWTHCIRDSSSKWLFMTTDTNCLPMFGLGLGLWHCLAPLCLSLCVCGVYLMCLWHSVSQHHLRLINFCLQTWHLLIPYVSLLFCAIGDFSEALLASPAKLIFPNPFSSKQDNSFVNETSVITLGQRWMENKRLNE
jgi:hypothetical protein